MTAMHLDHDYRRAALVLSASVWTWAEEAGLGIVDGQVLLALSEAGSPVDGIELSALSRLSLDSVFPALNRLTGHGYAREEHRLHSLTDAGLELVAGFDRAVDGVELP
jgi:hypothetical protein